jgi:regulator of sigma E protease
VPFSYDHDGQRGNTNFLISTTAASPDQFDPATLGFVPKMQSTPVKVSALVSGAPAELAGLKPGDQIVSIDDLTVHSVNALLAYMQDQKGKPALLNVLRDGHTLMIPITPELTDAGDGTKGYRLGFQYVPPPVKVERLSFLKSLSASWVFNKKKSLLVFDVLKGMFERHISVTSLSGPIGIAQVVHEAAQAQGWMPLVSTMAVISVNLGMFNLLPFPILDGGMIFFLLIESLFRRDIPMPVKERIYQVAFVCIVLFAAMVIFNDIHKLPFFAKLKS